MEKLAQDIVNEFKDEPLTCLCVLKVGCAGSNERDHVLCVLGVCSPSALPECSQGGHQFFADLINYIKQLNTSTAKPVPLSIDFIRFGPLAVGVGSRAPPLAISTPPPPFPTPSSLKSYHNTESTGEVKIIGGDDLSELAGRNVLVVEVGVAKCTFPKKAVVPHPSLPSLPSQGHD